jgi:predicted nucleic acid-binding protein
MIYIDTSVWVAMLCFEGKADLIKSWILTQKMQNVCCSSWVHAELMSALSIKCRRGEINLSTLAHLHTTIEGLTRNGSHWGDAATKDFQTASQLCADPATKLRAGDALHLAIAKRLKCKQFFTLDDVLSANALAMGFEPLTL